MNTYRYTPEKIVEEKLYFSIPLYQRLFSWGEEQVIGLLYDLKNHFETSYDDGTPYYLGMLSCIKSGNHYDLIDGQQRLTTVTLLISALAKFLNQNPDEDIGVNTNQLINYYLINVTEEGDLKYKIKFF